jgi:hypothetical protein
MKTSALFDQAKRLKDKLFRSAPKERPAESAEERALPQSVLPPTPATPLTSPDTNNEAGAALTQAETPTTPADTSESSSSSTIPAQNNEAAPSSAPTAGHVAPGRWHASGETIVGLSHRKKKLPCQDAIAWRISPRPILALSDGAGSAAVSEMGAAALVSGIPRFLTSLERDISGLLDSPTEPSQSQSASWVERLRLHAQGLLEDLAEAERREIRDLRATLLLAIVGQARTFWWQVGDGVIVVREGNTLRKLGDNGRSKGEFANQTCFVDKATSTNVQWGLIPSAGLTGIALMSDGGAERLVSSDGSRVAPRIGQWLDAVVAETLTPDKIALAFHEPAMWERTTLDDRAIVLASRLESGMRT